MITTTDIANILYADCGKFGIDTYQDGNIAKGAVKTERIVIHTSKQSSERIWTKMFAEVNFHVPDNMDGNANLIRLNELERLVRKEFKGTGWHDGTFYKYDIYELSIMQEKGLATHYVNARVLFQSMNTID